MKLKVIKSLEETFSFKSGKEIWNLNVSNKQLKHKLLTG